MSDLPQPTGYRLIIKPRELENKTAGGIILTDESKEAAKFKCVVSKVVSMGPECYKSLEKSSTIWCKEGDWVLTGKYVGLKFVYEKETYAIINDDEVIGIVPDPTKITHK